MVLAGNAVAETGFKLASLLNFIVFLHSGKYRCAATFAWTMGSKKLV